MTLHPRGRASLITQAKNLGIKDPESLDDKQLRKAVALYRAVKELRRHARILDINLPESITHLGTLRRMFLDEVERRLKSIKQGSRIRYKDKDWVVKKISRTHREADSRKVYVLKPVGGGRHITIPDTLVLAAADF